ncbi:AMP-binding protein [Streptomyces celluloflavus]|uniref:AMP-binding protein n=1 Tax=Streptomyces celluloflavus TaxID=58344 RepID=UPI00346126A9|nr:AMP-binding protein [Streptomyces celluloflavus]
MVFSTSRVSNTSAAPPASRVYRSEYADIAPVELPIHEAVLGPAASYGDRPALIDGLDGTILSYDRLDHATRRLAAALAAAGVRKGEVLALHSPNSLVYPVVFYAASRCGAAVTTVHPLATEAEFGKQLADSGARWIVTVSALLDTARAAARQTGRITEIFVCDRAEGHRSVQDLLAGTAPEPAVTLDAATDLAALPYSSGTTGTPKGVMLTHRSIATNLAQLDSLITSGPGDRVLAVLPFFHMYGLTALMNAPLRNGCTVVVLPRFDLERFLAAIAEHRITAAYVAPPIVLALAKHPLVAEYDLSSLRYLVSAAAPLDAELAAACSRRLGLPPVMQAYGMTELSPATHVVPLGAQNPPPGAVGKLLPGTEMRIVPVAEGDGGGGTGPRADLGVGETGEILIRGPQVMKGYLGRPAETDALIDTDGWLHTGDVGRVDGDGNEIPKAFVVRRSGSALSGEEVIAYVAGQVAPYKKVRRVEFLDSVPRATTGKILRRELRTREGSSTAR